MYVYACVPGSHSLRRSVKGTFPLQLRTIDAGQAAAKAKGKAKAAVKAKAKAQAVAAQAATASKIQLLCASDYNAMDICRVTIVLASALWGRQIQDLDDEAFHAVMRGQADQQFLRIHFGITSAAKLARMREERNSTQ